MSYRLVAVAESSSAGWGLTIALESEFAFSLGGFQLVPTLWGGGNSLSEVTPTGVTVFNGFVSSSAPDFSSLGGFSTSGASASFWQATGTYRLALFQ